MRIRNIAVRKRLGGCVPAFAAAWIVGMGNGHVNATDKSGSRFAWPVRAGQ